MNVEHMNPSISLCLLRHVSLISNKLKGAIEGRKHGLLNGATPSRGGFRGISFSHIIYHDKEAFRKEPSSNIKDSSHTRREVLGR